VLAGGGARAAADEARLFGVVDLSTAQRAPEPLRLEIERWAAARGLTKLTDPAMRQALAGSIPPRWTVTRLVDGALAKKQAGDCGAAVKQAGEAELAALGGLSVDDERESLKTVYSLLVACHDTLGQPDAARAAAERLRTLVSLPPSALSQELWDRYVPATLVAPATLSGAPAAGAAAGVELQVDSEPPNANVAINFHPSGLTPKAMRAVPGTVVYVELEKAGYKKAFRKVTVGRGTTHVAIPLGDRQSDRTSQIESTVATLRGIDLSHHRTSLARLAELARVDVLVAIEASAAGTVKMWWFDAERGDLVGAPIESPFDAKTGKCTNAALR
jgi:hypothetical protein